MKKNLISLLVLQLISFSVLGAADFTRKDHLIVIGKKFNTVKPIPWKKTYQKYTKNLFKENLNEIKEISKLIPKAAIKSGKVPKKSKNDELVFFDYTNKKIKKEENKNPVKTKSDFKNLKAFKGFKPKKSNKDFIDYTSLLSASYQKTHGSKFSIIPLLYDKRTNNKLTNYELIPYYDLSERLSDMGNGKIDIEIGDRQESVFRGLIQSRDNYPTNFEISVRDREEVEIPTFSYEKIEKILRKYKVKDVTGSHLLVLLGEEIDSTQLMSKYTLKVFLNRKMRVVDEGMDYIYELYLNAEPGNQLVKFMNRKGRIAEKIIHLSESEMTYDESKLSGKKNIEFSLYEEHLTSKKNVAVDIDENKVKLFNSNKSSVKTGLNTYKLLYEESINSFNNYFEVNRKKSVYVGSKAKKITIPSDGYLDYIMKIFNVSETGQECVVQINLSKPASEFKLDVKSVKSNGYIDILYMDKDGTVGKELTGLTNRIFVISSDYGALNFKTTLDKKDTRYQQSFCSENLYLIEQI